MKPARIVVICIAAVAAIGLALVVRAMGDRGGQPVSAAAAVEAAPTARVLVAAHDLAPGRRLSASDMRWADWPLDNLNPAYVTDGSVPVPVAEADPSAEADSAPEGAAEGAVTRAVRAVAGTGAQSDFVGAVVREAFVEGEPIITRKIVRAGDSGYLAAYLEPGMRAMAIRVSVETAAGGFILPGDRVDVILTRQLQNSGGGVDSGARSHTTSTVMQNVKVLAIDQTTHAGDDAQAVVGATATLEVAPSDAEVLSLARAEGELSLVLRSYADTGGPSGRTGRMGSGGDVRAVRVHRGDQVEVVVVQ